RLRRFPPTTLRELALCCNPIAAPSRTLYAPLLPAHPLRRRPHRVLANTTAFTDREHQLRPHLADALRASHPPPTSRRSQPPRASRLRPHRRPHRRIALHVALL